MRDVVIIGVGMTRFGKYLEKTPQELGLEATWNAIEDANLSIKQIQVAYFGNGLGPQLNEIKGVIGQHILSYAGFEKIPITNVENACSSGSTALRLACLEVASGNYDVALALGVEKMYTLDKSKAAAAMASGTPYAKLGYTFVAQYALNLKGWMEKHGVTQTHFAKVVAKNTANGALNPYAQFQKAMSVEEVLNSRPIADPLTLYMCASIGDGAAAVIVCPRSKASQFTSKPLVEVSACELASAAFNYPNEPLVSSANWLSKQAYEKAGIGPEDIDVAEVHDAMAPAELKLYEDLGFCQPGEASRMIDEGMTKIDGKVAVNPSGGLAAKGHPVGATGLAQVSEIVWQLRGEAGQRQVSGARVGMTQNLGGQVMQDSGACTVTVLKR